MRADEPLPSKRRGRDYAHGLVGKDPTVGKLEPIFTGEEEQEQFGAFSRRDFARIVFKHKWVIVLCFVATTAAAAFCLWYLPPTYTTEAKVLIKTNEGSTPSFFGGIAPIREPPLADPVNRVMETEMELVEAVPLSERVVDDLHLTYYQVYHKPYKILLDPVVDAYDWVLTNWFGMPPDPEKRGRRDTVNAFVKSLTVMPIKSKSAETNSNIISIKLRSPDPHIAQKALEDLLKYYTTFDVSMNEEAARKAYEIVSADLKVAEDQVLAAREKLRQFVGRAGVRPKSDGTAGAAATPANDALPAGPGEPRSLITTPRDVASLDRLKARLIDARIELANAKQVFRGESNARVQSLENLVAELERQIQAEVAVSASDESQVDALERDVKAADARYLSLLNKLEEIKLYRQMNQQHVSNRVVIEPPVLPTSSDLRFRLIIGAAAVLASLVVGLGLSGLLEYTDHTLQSRAAVQKHLGLPLLATIPKAGSRERALVTDFTRP